MRGEGWRRGRWLGDFQAKGTRELRHCCKHGNRGGSAKHTTYNMEK